MWKHQGRQDRVLLKGMVQVKNHNLQSYVVVVYDMGTYVKIVFVICEPYLMRSLMYDQKDFEV